MVNSSETKTRVFNGNFYYVVTVSVLMFVFSLVVNYIANIYVEGSASYPVTDLVLSHTRVYHLDILILAVTCGLILFGLYEALTQPKKLPFLLKTTALFILVRSAAITLTHIGPFTPHLIFGPNKFVVAMGLGNSGDLFFSGHTGMPFLWTLMFWNRKHLRYIFLAGSVTLGTFVLFAHLHYSIDVFSAFFITYSIFHISQRVFTEDWRLFNS